jgi:hypothetical protein
VSLTEEFRTFLASVKTSEGLSADLRQAITVQTGLEGALATALTAPRDVVIAGSAGGGKTHLLDVLKSSGESDSLELVTWPTQTEPSDRPFIRVIPDATALAREERFRIFDDRPPKCLAVAVAINEGPLLELARSLPSSPFAQAVNLLHQAQRGLKGASDAQQPVVLDVGGFDPIHGKVPGALLALPIARDLIEELPCGCEDRRVCPRRLAWELLSSSDVRQRVNDLLRLVNLRGQAVLFRDLWDFVADLILGGSCQDDPPTSPWFWRVFFGSSLLSTQLRSVTSPRLTVFPRAEAHIWYGDLLSNEIELLDGTSFVSPDREPFDGQRYQWLKAQLFFIVRYESVVDLVRDQFDLQLALALDEGRTGEIVAALNRYMNYGTLTAPRQVLDLWIDMGVERRMDRAEGQVAIGSVVATALRLRRSFAVANHSNPEVQIHGPRHFLVHEESEASLELPPEALNLLRGGRSYRTADRPHTDMEWHISRFFLDIGRTVARGDRLDVMGLDFDAMEGRVHEYRLSAQEGLIEPGGGGS